MAGALLGEFGFAALGQRLDLANEKIFGEGVAGVGFLGAGKEGGGVAGSALLGEEAGAGEGCRAEVTGCGVG